MKKSILKKINLNNIIYLPIPIDINIWWNFGSLLGFFLINQIIRGLFLSIHYFPYRILAYQQIIHIIQDVNIGWLFRLLHINGASFFFICIYIHIGRNLYYNSYNLSITWFIGVTIFILSIITAFIGYILPWGQISLWGATVITNLLSAIPIYGDIITKWIWGGFSINNATLNRFYSLHFIIPFILIVLIFLHLIFLHKTGRSNPIGLSINFNKISFYPYFIIKDLYGIIFIFFIILIICFLNPYLISDPENFIKANSIITPIHIQPEWYFLFAYAILRSIPNKLGGVIALLISILILYFLPLLNCSKLYNFKYYYYNKLIYWIFIIIFIILTWIGSKPIEYPFIIIGQFFSIIYFSYFFLNSLVLIYINKLFY